MNRYLTLTALALASSMSLGVMAATTPQAHKAGVAQAEAVSTVAAPERPVVYDLATLDTMQALGIPVAGVPKAQFPAYMAGYGDAKYTVAGTLFQPDYEALSQFKPDLIIVGGRSAAKQDVLSKIAPTLDFSVKPATMLQDIERNITQIADMYGKQEQGKALVARIKSEVAELNQLAAKAQPGVLLMAINERIMPQAPGARFGFLFDVLGAKSQLTAKDIPARGGPAFTFDDLAKLQPEWIYVIDRNTGVGAAAGGGEIIPSTKVFDNDKVKSTPAGQKGQIVFLDPKGWYLMGSTGPTALLNNVQQLKQAYRAAGIQ